MFEVLKVDIEENDTAFRVNGVELEKAKITSLFTGEPDKALAKYLCTVPFLDARKAHFEKYHVLSASAIWALKKAPELVKALNINETNTVPFMIMCLTQAGDGVDPSTISKELEKAFGECNSPDHDEEDSKPTVH